MQEKFYADRGRYTASMDLRRKLEDICREHDILAVYLFGSRADDGLRLLDGERVPREREELAVGVIFRNAEDEFRDVGVIQTKLEILFDPVRVFLVLLHKANTLFQFEAISGHRICTLDSYAADVYELRVMREAEELLWLQKQMELEEFSVSTT